MRTLQEVIDDWLGDDLSRWETEIRAGVAHWRTGQHIAEHVESDPGHDEGVYALAYVPLSGHHIFLVCAVLVDGVWRPVGDEHGTFVVARTRRDRRGRASRTFELTDRMRAVLDAALGR
jgi:hypothetical protein